jgi:hypothetical protein
MVALNCQNLANAVASDDYSVNPVTLQFALQVFAAAASIAALNQLDVGYVFSANYSGVAPAFTPSTGAAIAIDSATRRQWQYTATGGWM